MDRSSRLEGQDWQRWANKLLHCHYAKGDYQEVPDTDRGDAGIEGFTTNGRVYQMYGPEGDLTVVQKHTKLRDKMTKDLVKFIANKDGKLSKLFGTTRIKRWILLVPSFDSKETVEHAAKKTQEILDACLPYVDPDDFKVILLAEDAFAKERAALLSHAVEGIDIQADSVGDSDIDGWSEDDANVPRLEQLTGKTAKMPTLTSAEQRRKFEREVIRWWLEGQNVLDGLRDYPEAWEAIRRAKSEQEKYLQGHCMVTDQAPYALLKQALEQIEQAVSQQVHALAPGSRNAIAHEAVADWLLRCPLDFPEVMNNA
jgi:hypothetical protein